MKLSIALLLFLLPFFAFAQNTSTECLAGKKLKIVVIGSSTAAGSGASTPDSAWVNRYRKHLQTFNPENEVVNLAVGGYNTYKLMPHEFVAPTNRPTPDSSKNITAALNEMPNAIIVNLPSNDASSGFSAAEQLSNFDSIVNMSNRLGVPIWVCTTQPKNFNNTNLVQVQTEVRDSIFARYGDHSLDFWNGLANPAGGLDSLFDSSDGTHLNDAGHGLLFRRVRDRMIPLDLVLINNGLWQYSALSFEPIGGDVFCQGEEVNMQLTYTNLGLINLDDVLISIYQFPDNPFVDSFRVASPSTCEVDTLIFPAERNSLFWFIHNQATAISDESGFYTIERNPSPQFTPEPQTICKDKTAFFDFDFQNTDTVFWYDKPTGGNIIANGETFQTGTINRDTTFWAEAINGDLFYKKNLFTTDEFNRDWNGIMFDLTVTEDAILDSFYVNMFSIGERVFEIYKKDGSLIGSEQDAAAWTIYKRDTVRVDFNGDNVLIPNVNLSFSANDTVALYLRMQDPSADLNYLAPGNNDVISDDILSMANGTGITAGFTETYFPRRFTGEFFYHYGSRPQGECSTGRVPVEVNISQPEIDLPEREIISERESFLLDAGAGFSEYQWSTGDSTQTILVYADSLGEINNVFWVEVIDQFGCIGRDSTLITFFPTNVEENTELNLSFFPNPGNGSYRLTGDPAFAEIELFDPSGKRLFSKKENLPATFDWKNLNTGLYFLKIRTEKGIQIIKLKHM